MSKTVAPVISSVPAIVRKEWVGPGSLTIPVGVNVEREGRAGRVVRMYLGHSIDARIVLPDTVPLGKLREPHHVEGTLRITPQKKDPGRIDSIVLTEDDTETEDEIIFVTKVNHPASCRFISGLPRGGAIAVRQGQQAEEQKLAA